MLPVYVICQFIHLLFADNSYVWNLLKPCLSNITGFYWVLCALKCFALYEYVTINVLLMNVMNVWCYCYCMLLYVVLFTKFCYVLDCIHIFSLLRGDFIYKFCQLYTAGYLSSRSCMLRHGAFVHVSAWNVYYVAWMLLLVTVRFW